MPFPFIGPTYQTFSRNVGVERLMNLYVEVTESPGEAIKATYYGTPGIKTLTTLPDSPGRGLFFQDGHCFAVAGQTLYELTIAPDGSSVVVTTRGTVANDGQPVTMCSSGLNGHQLFVV